MTAAATPLPKFGAGAVWNGAVRAAVVVFGGVLVLQSSPTLDPPKVAYLILAVTAALSSAVVVWRAARDGTLVDRRVPFASVLLLVLLAASLPVALAQGTSVSLWLRDAATYGLFGFAAFFAADLERSTSRPWILGLFVTAGLLVTGGFTVEWMDRRDILRLTLPWTPLPSGALPSALFATASAFALRSDRRFAWAILAGVLLASFLLIGTRSRLPLVALPFLLVALSGRRQWRKQLPSVAALAATTVIVFAAAVLALGALSGQREDPVTTVNAGKLGERIGSIGDLVRNPAGDPSFQERIAQTKAAWNVFISSPIVGTGPGHEISWTNSVGREESGYYLDTPVMELAKFGIVGLAVGLVWIGAFALVIRDGIRRARDSPEVLALIGYSVILVYSLPLSPPTQDKGTALALIFLIALIIRAMRGKGQRAAQPPRLDGAAL